ncbi:MAG: SpoIIE family protein phosphatase [Clostridia bacterium]|nr:SpoIIE family protein phosphatase [Clostridia bacterium]
MPEKNVRDMTKFERLHNSLATRTFRATLMGAIVLGVLALIIGLAWYAYLYCRQTVHQAFGISKNVQAIMNEVVDPAAMGNDVMTIYRSLTDEERAEEKTNPEKYYARYSEITGSEAHAIVLAILDDFRDSGTANDVYFAMYDKETKSIVYIADSDNSARTGVRTGSFESASEKEINKFLNWDEKKILYNIENTQRFGWICTSGVSVKNPDGSIAGFILSDLTLKDIASGMKGFAIFFSISMFIVVILLAVLMARHMEKKLVKPINEIAGAAEAYVKDKKAGVKYSEHFSGLKINTGDELENLALTMADMEGELADHEEDLARIAAEKERIGTELSLATKIQADMLPNIFPAFPDKSEFDIYASMKPAKEVGGDFYDFFLIDADHLGLVIADVSGKGVPAALFMMVSKILVQNIAMSGKSPAQVLRSINTQICSNNREEMFVTVWFGSLDLRDGTLRAANAGHEYPILKKPDGDFELVKDKHGFVVGGMPDAVYTEYELKLEPGAKLFLYTDGVTEATDEIAELFGTDRLLSELNKVKDESTEDIIKSMNDCIALYSGDTPQFDDVTMMCLHYSGKGATGLKQITVDAKVENIAAVTDFINSELEMIGCPFKAKMQIDVAIDELFGNIAHYAYGEESGTATVRFKYEKEADTAEITFIDSGVPYDPLAKEDPDVTLGVKERAVGGLGIFLVKKTMDSMEYERKNDKNVLKIRKKLR